MPGISHGVKRDRVPMSQRYLCEHDVQQASAAMFVGVSHQSSGRIGFIAAGPAKFEPAERDMIELSYTDRSTAGFDFCRSFHKLSPFYMTTEIASAMPAINLRKSRADSVGDSTRYVPCSYTIRYPYAYAGMGSGY